MIDTVDDAEHTFKYIIKNCALRNLLGLNKLLICNAILPEHILAVKNLYIFFILGLNTSFF